MNVRYRKNWYQPIPNIRPKKDRISTFKMLSFSKIFIIFEQFFANGINKYFYWISKISLFFCCIGLSAALAEYLVSVIHYLSKSLIKVDLFFHTIQYMKYECLIDISNNTNSCKRKIVWISSLEFPSTYLLIGNKVVQKVKRFM